MSHAHASLAKLRSAARHTQVVRAAQEKEQIARAAQEKEQAANALARRIKAELWTERRSERKQRQWADHRAQAKSKEGKSAISFTTSPCAFHAVRSLFPVSQASHEKKLRKSWDPLRTRTKEAKHRQEQRHFERGLALERQFKSSRERFIRSHRDFCARVLQGSARGHEARLDVAKLNAHGAVLADVSFLQGGIRGATTRRDFREVEAELGTRSSRKLISFVNGDALSPQSELLASLPRAHSIEAVGAAVGEEIRQRWRYQFHRDCLAIQSAVQGHGTRQAVHEAISEVDISRSRIQAGLTGHQVRRRWRRVISTMRAAIAGRRKRNHLGWAHVHIERMLQQDASKAQGGGRRGVVACYSDHDASPRVRLLKPLTGDREGQTLLMGYCRVDGATKPPPRLKRWARAMGMNRGSSGEG